MLRRSGTEYVLLNTDEVYAFQAEGDLVWVLTVKNKFLATQTLSSQRWLVTLNNRMEFVVRKRQARSIRHLLNR